MRKMYWYLTAYAKKHGLVFLGTLLLAIILFSFTLPFIINRLENRTVSYYGFVGDFNLELKNLPSVLNQKVSVGLTTVQPDGSTLPVLADRWTVEQEGTIYRFLLKEGLVWQDGSPLLPNEISYDLGNTVDTIPSETDVVFKLPTAYSPFPVVVSAPIFKKSSISWWGWFSKPTLIGLGEYRIVDYESQGNRLKSLTIENDNERIVSRFYLTEEQAILAFKHGEVDYLPEMSQDYGLSEWHNVAVSSKLDQTRALALFFKTSDPRFDKNIRQAFAYALTKPTDTSRAIGPISPLSWAYFPGGKRYDRDWDRATERLLSAIPGQALNIVLTTTPQFTSQAESIEKELESFGEFAFEQCQTAEAVKDKALCENTRISITLKIIIVPDVTSFEMLLTGQATPPDPDQYALWHSSNQTTNITNYKNTRIDKLLEDGRTKQSKNERIEVYQEFQQFFLEDVPALFISHLPVYTIERTR